MVSRCPKPPLLRSKPLPPKRTDKPKECLCNYKTTSIEHPGVRMVAMERGPIYIGGKVFGVSFPKVKPYMCGHPPNEKYYTYLLSAPKREFPCITPTELREQLPGTSIIAFQVLFSVLCWQVASGGGLVVITMVPPSYSVPVVPPPPSATHTPLVPQPNSPCPL